MTSYILLASLFIVAGGGVMIMLAHSLVNSYSLNSLVLSLPFG